MIGDYLHITDPEALAQLLALDGLSVRFYRSGGRSFHPKAYLFRNAETGLSIVGSSNISNSALRSGIEWNVHLPQAVAPQILDDAIDAFMDLYLSESAEELNPVVLDAYRQEYAARQYVAEPEVEYDEGTVVVAPEILPHRVQEEALQALRETMEEGRTRALVVLATGLGKTYLSAFFAGDFYTSLVLAHQKELLLQQSVRFKKSIRRGRPAFISAVIGPSRRRQRSSSLPSRRWRKSVTWTVLQLTSLISSLLTSSITRQRRVTGRSSIISRPVSCSV